MEAAPLQNLAPFTRLLRGETDERVFELEKLVAATRGTPGWDVLVGLLDTAVQASLNELRYLQVKEHAAITRDLGWGAGALSVVDCADAVQREADKRRDAIRKINERREAVAA